MMKYPTYPIEPKERACYRVSGDNYDGHENCPGISCESSYLITCTGTIPCFGDCKNCTVRLNNIWRGRCQCYKRRMILDKEEKVTKATLMLRDVLPKEALGCEFVDGKINKYLDYEVIETITKYDVRRPFKHKNIYVWWILEGGIAVAWNENPSRGWSFPVAKIKPVINHE